MIEIRKVWFRYGSNSPYVLKNINLILNAKITIVIGPNGSGKTTLLKIIAGILKPVSGEVIINNLDFWKLSRNEQLKLRRNIVYVHEEPYLFRGTVIDNVSYPLRLRGYSKEHAISEALKTLSLLRIKSLASKNVKSLSAGQVKMVALARALAPKPKYILLDEPSANLDEEHRNIVFNAIRKISNEESYVVIASHHKEFIRLASHIILIKNGEIVEQHCTAS